MTEAATTDTRDAAFLTRKELCQRWGCSISSIKRREKAEGRRATHLGPRMVRYRLSDVIAYEQRQ